MRSRLALLLPLLMVLTSGMSTGHSPVDPEGGISIETATLVEDPAKSWAIYGHLDEAGDAWYFKMDLSAEDRLYLSLLSTDKSFVPDLVVMGPGWESPAGPTPDVEVPEGYGWVLVEGEETEADFEPFTPGSYYHVAVYDQKVNQTGTYYAVVHAGEGYGPFSIAVGYLETFTASEWLSLPASLVGIYRWEGQSWALILWPVLLVLVGGLAYLIWRTGREGRALTVFQWTSAVSGLFFLTWAIMVITQMTMAIGKSGWSNAALVTLGFASGSVLMAMYSLSPALVGLEVPDPGRRFGMLLVAGLALFLYSGLYIGPTLAVISALLPPSIAGIVPGSGVSAGVFRSMPST